ncbi:MAG: hypothetical protein NTY22_08105 [Proteobacteria bacterium]|nr:hypothetical protein [Pseudomonadota bacterium]
MNAYKIFKNLILITISTLFFISCETSRLPDDFKYKMYKYDEIDCSGKTKNCLKTSSGMLFFVEDGYLFQLDPYYMDKYVWAYESWTGVKGIKKLLPYRDLLIGLTDLKELYIANEKKQFVKVAEGIEDVEVEANDVVVIKVMWIWDAVQIFDGEMDNSDFVYYGPLSKPAISYYGNLEYFEGFYNVKNGKKFTIDSIPIYLKMHSAVQGDDIEITRFERTPEGILLVRYGELSVPYKELKEGWLIKKNKQEGSKK